jgi:benzoyl-CoA reductase subunit C
MDAPLTPVVNASARAAVVARAEELYLDLRLGSVRRWKAEAPGRKAIGFLPMYVPREAIHAAGMLPVGIMGGGDMEVVKGDAYFQSYICHLPRSTIELGLNGSLDCLDGLIFPSTCDVIRNLSGMWQILFPDCYVHYFDMPQNFDDAIGGVFYERELRHLIGDLERLSGRKVTDDALRASIAVYNENRKHVDELYALRVREPWQVPTSELYLLLRAANVLPVEEHTKLCRDYLAAVAKEPRRPQDMARVSIRGTFCEQPPLDLIRTLERSGCFIVEDDWVLVARWGKAGAVATGDPVKALVAMFLHGSPSSCPSILDVDGTRGAKLVAAAREARAEGVIFAAPSFCDPALLEQPMTMAAVKAAGIPSTSFLYAESNGQFQVIREQAGTFSDSIRLA